MNPIKTIILFLVIAFPLFLHGQSLEDKSNKKFSIGISFSPDFSYRNLQMNDDEYGTVDMRNEIEEPRLGFTTGLVAKYQLNEKFALESGVQIADKGERIVFKDYDFVDEFGKPVNDPAIPKKATNTSHYKYIGIPLKVNYYFLEKEMKMFISVGSSVDFFLNGKGKTVLKYDDRVERDSYELNGDFNKVNFIGVVGFGIERNISSKLTFQFEPTLRYSLTPVFDAPINEYFYSIGANFVLLYH
jgi:hypothetical protein